MTFFLITAISSFINCKSPHEVVYLKAENNGEQINIFRNQEIVLSLDANPSTGYTWTVSHIDSTILKQEQEVEYKSSSQKIGSPGKQIFHFRTVSIGQTELQLIYHRPWEKEVAPLNTYKIRLNVTN